MNSTLDRVIARRREWMRGWWFFQRIDQVRLRDIMAQEMCRMTEEMTHDEAVAVLSWMLDGEEAL